jgi:hypothetical protein
MRVFFSKTSKQVVVLQKLKFKVSQNFLETMYLTFIRPLLEYAGEVWVIVLSPTQNGLKKFNLKPL